MFSQEQTSTVPVTVVAPVPSLRRSREGLCFKMGLDESQGVLSATWPPFLLFSPNSSEVAEGEGKQADGQADRQIPLRRHS